MTRDPSDGSVREKQQVGQQPNTLETTDKQSAAALLVTTGLSEFRGDVDQLARLQRSRDWLSKYRTDPEGALRRMGETDWVNPETGQTDLLND